jgi:hypothetical protein
MFWLSFRQFRTQAVVAAIALAGLAVVVVIVGSQVLADYYSAVRSGTTNGFIAQYQQMGQWLSALVLVVPGFIGIFWGAPLLARELESGTFRLAWTQSISRARWTLSKLGLLGLTGIAVAGLCSLLVTWWSSPLDAIGAGPFTHFDTRGIVPMGYAVFAFALGVAAGAVTRRTVAAMGITLLSFVAVRLAFVEWVRPHLMTPLVSRQPFKIASSGTIDIGNHLREGSWVISQSMVNATGQKVGGGPAGGFLNIGSATLGPAGVSIRGVGTCSNIHASVAQVNNPHGVPDLVARCINQLHLTSVTTYQPANRYWPFQTYETLIFLALAAAIGAFTVWWVRRVN